MILVIDNYDSFTYNLVHLVGEHTDTVEVVRNDKVSVEDVRDAAPDGILISPGPGRPADAGIIEDLIRELGSEIPTLGVCLGHQAIGEVFGAEVTHAPELMHGKASLIAHDERFIFEGLDMPFEATRYHSLVVKPGTIPDELEVSARAKDTDVVMAFRHQRFPISGIQFHPESVLTEAGSRLIQNWLRSAHAS